MKRTMLTTFAAAALLSLAAVGSATAKIDASLMPAGEPRAGPMARMADVLGPLPAERTIRVAPNYMKFEGIKGEVT